MRQGRPCPETPELSASIGPIEVDLIGFGNAPRAIGSLEVFLQEAMRRSLLGRQEERIPIRRDSRVNGLVGPEPSVRLEAERKKSSFVQKSSPHSFRDHLRGLPEFSGICGLGELTGNLRRPRQSTSSREGYLWYLSCWITPSYEPSPSLRERRVGPHRVVFRPGGEEDCNLPDQWVEGPRQFPVLSDEQVPAESLQKECRLEDALPGRVKRMWK